MIMTILEAQVASEQWEALQQAWQAQSEQRPAQLVQSFLVQSTTEPTLWRGISIWPSRQALEEMRRDVSTPGGVLIFRAAGAEPTLSLFEIVDHLPSEYSSVPH